MLFVAGSKPVEDANAIIFGEIHLPNIFKMIVVASGLDHRSEGLGGVDGADRDPRLWISSAISAAWAGVVITA